MHAPDVGAYMAYLRQRWSQTGLSSATSATPVPACEVVMCPPATLLGELASECADMGVDIAVGGQNCHAHAQGAFTGEISASMLRRAGARWVILGHSERRAHAGETDTMIAARVQAAQSAGLNIVLCVGEDAAEREQGCATAVVTGQLEAGLLRSGTRIQDAPVDVVIAYEPVWAIGTGQSATPHSAAAMHREIRRILAQALGGEAAAATRLVYGGSINRDNARALFAMEDIDGGLIGGASLDAHEFADICAAAR